jgi:hypothetical protein
MSKDQDLSPGVSPSDAFGTPAMPKRRRHSSVWKNTPKGLKIAAVLCLVFLAVVLYINRNRTPVEPELKAVKPKVTAGEAFDKVMSNTPKQLDLALTKSALNPNTSRIEGVISNTSSRRYSNVEIVFFVSLSDLTVGTTTVVRLASLDPGANAPFTSDPVDPRTKEWAVQAIRGTPR